ncbi:lantibiotic dehydratase [Mucilaginibacter sp. 21P]|uniref:lantibiotic dehydratase n=1 Tax=Mucilaginibacter sp. 21P TaxID=2778902 RepID=UPI001C589284|nr:lantibiotic dehydratase [Mucilaginibacter sp. 21P]QXV63903.1 lantibiotic dehydratase [Mucilaginibacter sp. 21P]
MTSYRFFPSLVVRNPAMPFNGYSVMQVKDHLKLPFFKNAIFLASKTFYRELEKKGFDYDLLTKKEKGTLIKYVNRMSHRPTPFGLFSSFSVLEWDRQDKIVLEDRKVHFKYDFKKIIQVTDHISLYDQEKCTYVINHSMYKVGEVYRYLTRVANEDEKCFNFSICAIEANLFLEQIISHCQVKRSFDKIVNFISDNEDIEPDYAKNIIGRLIDLQVLLNNQMPNITGSAYEDYLKDQGLLDGTACVNIEQGSGFITSLNEPTGNDLLLKNVVDNTHDYYVNLERNTVANSLSDEYQVKLEEGLKCLIRLSSVNQPNTRLSSFVKAFRKKFDAQVVPLLYCLDPETGVGYDDLAESGRDKTLLDDIVWQENVSQQKRGTWSELHSFFLEKGQLGSMSTLVINITDDDLNKLTNNSEEVNLPPTTSLIFRIVNDRLIIESAGSVTGTALIGRFTRFNAKIADLARQIAQAEQRYNSDVLFADIAHICNYHTANINSRLNIYSHEIPVLTSSVVEDDSQIHLDDLWVSVNSGQLILQSKKHKKRVIPRLSSAFNHNRNNLTVFRFLCDVQYDQISSNWQLDLSELFPGLTYYPRIEYKSVIIALAEWHLKKNELSFINTASKTECLKNFNKFRSVYNLPDVVALTVHDHQLVFDLNINEDVFFFIETVKAENSFVVREFLMPDTDGAIVKDTEGKPYISQFVASLYHWDQIYQPLTTSITETPVKSRNMMPGGEWLYFKLYCHTARANEIIVEHLLPVINALLDEEKINQWFFVRYLDPDFHLRLRVKCNGNNEGAIFAQITKVLNQLVGVNAMSNYQVSIYEREIERYSAGLIEYFEDIFYHSSQYVCDYLNQTLIDGLDLDYDIFAFISTQNIIRVFNLDGDELIAFLSQVCDNFSKEFKIEESQKHRLDTKFRSFRKRLDDLLHTPGDDLNLLCYGVANTSLVGSIQQLLAVIWAERSDLKLKWLADIVHMHLNRIFVEDSRRQEYIIYFLLFKYEKAALARKQKNNLKRPPMPTSDLSQADTPFLNR